MKIRAIAIDPEEQTLSEVEVDNSVRDLQAAVNGVFQGVVTLSNGDQLLVDDDGHKKGHTTGFFFDTFPKLLVGRAILVGTDGNNYSHAKSRLDSIDYDVVFVVYE